MTGGNVIAKVLLLAGIAIVQLAAAAEPLSDGPWRYLTRKPANGWEQPGFNDSAWREGLGGFGVRTTPGARVSTDWAGDNIWLRRQIEIKELPARPALLVHHDEDAEVYLNGTRIAALTGFITQYKTVLLDEAGRAVLRTGKNLLAVHCRQTGGGQFIDVHLVDADNVPQLPTPQRSTRPFKSELLTQWGAEVTPENAWREYPRPQLVRKEWQNLNGSWDYAVTSLDAPKPANWDGKILVPFAPESRLSGVRRLLDPTEALWYHRTLEAQKKPGRRTLLNFEAVDYRSRVWVNDKLVGEHVGGSDPFHCDITDALTDGANHLVVRVEDATGGAQLRGKQRLDPQGIWYTRVSGIWQTVWLEEVSPRHLERLKITTDPQAGSITIEPTLAGSAAPGEQLRAVAVDGENVLAQTQAASGKLTLTLKEPKLWSPANPHLYDLKLSLQDAAGQTIDEIGTYAGLRQVGQTRGKDGHLRFTLNGETLFHWGPLDQGWWPDGLLTPPSDTAMRWDIEFLQTAGFNMIRKHIKVEPRRYYYHCDRLGMLVWQDQVSGGKQPAWTRLEPDPKDAVWTDADHAQFQREFAAMIDLLQPFPSIVVWTPFNEAWGQHRTVEVGKWAQQYDATRHINVASGGNFWPVGHIVDAHSYPHPVFPFDAGRYDRDYIKVMGEFGGHGWPVAGHLWNDSQRNWGYGGLPQTIEEYKQRYRESLRRLVDLKAKGIAAGVYTQTTDVEDEINGLVTYDRKVIKIPAAELRQMHEVLGVSPR